MSDIRIATRYAKSILVLAEEKNLLEDVLKDMKSFQEVCKSNFDLVLTLKNPIINTPKKAAILNAIFASSFNSLTMTFFKLITKKGREFYLPMIADCFITEYRILKEIEEIEVKSATKLPQSILETFKAFVKERTGKKEVVVKEIIDKDLIGGFTLKFNDQMIDDSISGKLNELKLKFAKNQYIKTY